MEPTTMLTPRPLPSSISQRVWSLWALCFLTGCLGAAALTLTGCSAGGTAAKATAGAEGPAKAAVVEFLEAIKRGDDTAASGMLTKVARAKTQELGLTVAPPVNSTATYEVRACEVVGEDGDMMHVETTWKDVDADGFQNTDHVVWVVRLDPEGWRLAGMAMKIFDDMPPLLLDFEDPEDMIYKQELVAAELQKRAGAEAESGEPSQQAQASPAASPTSPTTVPSAPAGATPGRTARGPSGPPQRVQ